MASQHRDVDGGWAWVVLVTSMISQIFSGAVAISVALFQVEVLCDHTSSLNSRFFFLMFQPVYRMVSQHRDVDGGWAWVVLVTSMVSQIFSGAVAISVGLFKAEFVSYFNSSHSYVSLVCSVNMCLQLTMGPVASVLCHVLGMRVAMMIGGVLLSLGLFLSSFANSLTHLLALYGVVGGIGFGITYCIELVALGHYFHKRRALANGLVVGACGIGVGPGSSLINWIIDAYGWRMAMSVLAAITLHKVVIGSTYYPLVKKRICCYSKATKEVSVATSESWLWFLGNIKWWILCVSYGVSMVGFATYLVHFPSYVLSCGLSRPELASLMATFGVVMSCSRVLGGFFCNDTSVDLLVVLFATTGLYGMTTVLMPLFANTFSTLMAYQVIMCIFYGTSLVPLTPLIVQLFGVDKLATVLGWIMLWGGLGYLVGPVLAGVLYDLTSSYVTAFYVGGGAVVLSALLLLLIPLMDKKEKDLSTSDKLQKLIHEDKTVIVSEPLESHQSLLDKREPVESNESVL